MFVNLKHFLSFLWGIVCMCGGGHEVGAPGFQLLLLLCTVPHPLSTPCPPSGLSLCSCCPALCMPIKPSLSEGHLVPMVALGLLVWHKL